MRTSPPAERLAPSAATRAPLIALLLALGASALADEPRPYGHVIGDLLVRTVPLALPPGRTLDLDALPKPGRVDTWLELHSLALQERELVLRYQVINVGPSVVTTVLPALSVPLRGGAANEALTLADWPVHLSPLTPRFAVARGELDALQPDIAPVREPLAPIVARLAAIAALALLLAAPWLVSRCPQLAFWRRRAPLRDAWRELRRLSAHADANAQRRAFTRLHAALDAAAGSALFAERTEPLYRAQPALREAAAEIDAFYAASREAFFGSGEPGFGAPRLRALAHTLARLEVAGSSP